jgi:hypothetical protein
MTASVSSAVTTKPKLEIHPHSSSCTVSSHLAHVSKVIVKVALASLAVIVSYGSIVAAGVCVMMYTGNWKVIDEVKTMIISAASATALKMLDSIASPVKMFKCVYDYLGTFKGLKTASDENVVSGDTKKPKFSKNASDADKSSNPLGSCDEENASEPTRPDEEEKDNTKKTLFDRLHSSSVTVTLTFEQFNELFKKYGEASQRTLPSESRQETSPVLASPRDSEAPRGQSLDRDVDCA